MKLLVSVCLLLFALSLKSQELNCSVDVVHPGVATNETRVFESLKQSIFEFMNNTKWTSDNFKVEERIGCSIFMLPSPLYR